MRSVSHFVALRCGVPICCVGFELIFRSRPGLPRKQVTIGDTADIGSVERDGVANRPSRCRTEIRHLV